MENSIVVAMILYVLLSLVVGVASENRRIGIGKAIVCSLLFTPIIGIIVSMLSKHNDDIEIEKKMLKALSTLSGLSYEEDSKEKDSSKSYYEKVEKSFEK